MTDFGHCIAHDPLDSPPFTAILYHGYNRHVYSPTPLHFYTVSPAQQIHCVVLDHGMTLVVF